MSAVHSTFSSFFSVARVAAVLAFASLGAIGTGCASTGTGTEPIFDAAQRTSTNRDSSNADSRVADNDRWSADHPVARRF